MDTLKILTVFPFFFMQPLWADDLTDLYGDTIMLASGYEQLVKESPSSIYVINSEEIEAIGAITLEEVLATVPGIHVSYSNGFFPVYVIRGMGSETNAPILMYLDGIAINSAVESSSHFSLSHLTKNIERIEIIKGPGSALYGADAFSGVINIITKQRTGTDMGTFVGSLDTYGGWLNHGFKSHDIKVNFSAQGSTTNGSQGIVSRDRQTLMDSAFNTSASLAPSSINNGKEEIDIKLSAHYKKQAELYLRYIHNKTQNGVGIAKALDNKGYIQSDSWVTGLKLRFGPSDWLTTLDLNYTGYVFDAQANMFPQGAMGGIFVDPVIDNFGYTSHIVSTQIATLYERIENHKIHVGAGFKYNGTTGVHEERNFIQGPFNSLLPIGPVQDVQEIGVPAFANGDSRSNGYGFVQDEWNFLNDFSLTTGVRLDYFSDFGLTVNPRASLIWNASYSLTTKLMYGRAFRAPSFFEMYSNKGIAITGNPDLEPETTQTVEWSIDKQWAYNFRTQLNLFWYETDNLITESVFVDTTTQSESHVFINSEGANTYGVEVDANYQVLENLTVDMNYTYLKIDPKNTAKDVFIITAPAHQVFAAINWEFIPNWSTNLRSTSIIGRERSSLDSRSAIADYTLLDFTLRGQKVLGYFDLTFKVNNLLGANVRYPSTDGTSIPGDYPINDRTFMGMISVKL